MGIYLRLLAFIGGFYCESRNVDNRFGEVVWIAGVRDENERFD